MKNDEILIVQDYLKITFGNEDIQIRKLNNFRENFRMVFGKHSFSASNKVFNTKSLKTIDFGYSSLK